MTVTRNFGEWVESYRNGFGRRPREGEDGPIVLRIADVSGGRIDLSSPRRGQVSRREADTYRLERGDLLFVRVNGAREIVGRCCVVGDDLPPDTIFNDHLIRVRLKVGLDPEFAKFYMDSQAARQVIEEAAATSAGQLTINQTVLDTIRIPDFSLEKQRLIAARLKEQLSAISQATDAARAQLRDFESLPARVIAQSFDEI